MPLVPEDRVTGLRSAVHEALVTTANMPQDDLFHIVHRLAPAGFISDPVFPGMARSSDAVVIEITFRMGRTEVEKQALYRKIVRFAQADAAMRSDDIMVVLTENTSLDWSFGGVAHYALNPVPV
ncbi:MAG: tautomerase family protein [Hoeflea sp.]|uniref:tautomerase family protein n=1 Tax=Hoeflea sp. TaxID=1940281 RepID=UPI003EF4843F